MFSQFTDSVLELERALILLGEMVEKDVVNVMMACIEGSDTLADEIARFDDEIDRLDESITFMVQEVFAAFNPKAGDLRFLLAVPKVSSHLEIIGDHCVEIAKNLKKLDKNKVQVLDAMNYLSQFETIIAMTTGAVNALIDRSAKRAWRAMALLEKSQSIRSSQLNMLAKLKVGALSNNNIVRLTIITNSLYAMACDAADIAANVVYITHGVDVRYQRYRILEQLSAKSSARTEKQN